MSRRILQESNLTLSDQGGQAFLGFQKGRDLVVTQRAEVRRRQIPPDGYPGFKAAMDAVGAWAGQTYLFTKEGK